MNLDCQSGHRDAVQEIVHAVSQVFVGIPPPEGVNNLPP